MIPTRRAENLLETDLLIRDGLDHTGWNNKGICFANLQASITDAHNKQEYELTYKQSNYERPDWHMCPPQFDAKNS